LRQDFSNVDEVLERVRDHELLQTTADRAYEEIYIDGTYRYGDFAAAIREALETGPGRPRPAHRAAFPAVAATNRVRTIPIALAARVPPRLRRPARSWLARVGAVLRHAGLRA